MRIDKEIRVLYLYDKAPQLRDQFNVREATGTISGSINKIEFSMLSTVYSHHNIDVAPDQIIRPTNNLIQNIQSGNVICQHCAIRFCQSLRVIKSVHTTHDR